MGRSEFLKGASAGTEAELLDGRTGRQSCTQGLELNRMHRGQAMTETMWRCDQVRAGQLYNRMMFNTREEAEQFMNQMRQVEPDQMISVEAVDARQVWN